MTRVVRETDPRNFAKSRWNTWYAAFVVALGFLLVGAVGVRAETRSLKIYHVHTGEKAEIVFKRDGRYDQEGLKKLNYILRDWRKEQPIRMDPRLFDLVWEVYRAVGATNYIYVVCGYRSADTNSMLRSRSRGVAEKSQHILGKAMDFFIPGVSLQKLRETGMKMQGGGVGYYPRSGSPFVHMDVGNVRHWPKMSRTELVRLFPNGNTLHVPSDGKPLPGFQQALAAYEARKKKGETAIALASTSGPRSPARNLLAALFGRGGGADAEEDAADDDAVQASPRGAVAAAKAPAAKAAVAAAPVSQPTIQVVAPDKANRIETPTQQPEIADEPAPAPAADTPETIIAALPARAVPLPGAAPRPKADVGPVEVASADPVTPDEIPFGPAAQPSAAEDQQPDPAAAAVAANVPVPTARPALPKELVAAADPVAPADAAGDAGVALPETTAALPQDSAAAPLLLALAGDDSSVPLPSERPDQQTTGSAYLPAGDDQKAAVAAAVKANSERVAALADVTAASQATAAGQADAVAAVESVKTTSKSARASRSDLKPGRKPVVVAAAPQAARWVLNKDYVANASQNTKAPSYAYNIVVSAPREVYTAGFQKGPQLAANRFTGSAVKFLSVARFN